MTNLYRSPLSVQKVIKKHLPRSFSSVLDPAVGDGALITCLPEKNKAKITCVDIIKERVDAVSKLQFLKSKDANCINADFLKIEFDTTFDLILMNPPFLGKKSDFVTFEGRRIPIEVAFVFKALSHANTVSKIIFVLPNTLISNDLYSWARDRLLDETEITHVYELASFSFSGVESKFHILICKKTKSTQTRSIKLIDLNNHHVTLRKSDLKLTNRLDYQYWANKFNLDSIRESQQWKFTKLISLAAISRGIYKSKDTDLHDIHITDNTGFHWTSRKTKILPGPSHSNYNALKGDILVRRVGRNCHRTFGLSPSIGGALSDCVIKIKPNQKNHKPAILISLRILSDLFPSLIINGTGAQYISKRRLNEVPVFLDIFNHLPFSPDQYLSAMKNNQQHIISQFESIAIDIVKSKNKKAKQHIN